jgi:hypothetical protein
MGLYDDVAGALDHAAGSTDEATHRALEGASDGDPGEVVKHATGHFVVAGDDTGRAETLTEGLFSPGEQYTATGSFRTAVDTVFENPEDFTNQEDSVDLPGPSVGDAADTAANPDDWGPSVKLLAASIVALGVLYLLRPFAALAAGVTS